MRTSLLLAVLAACTCLCLARVPAASPQEEEALDEQGEQGLLQVLLQGVSRSRRSIAPLDLETAASEHHFEKGGGKKGKESHYAKKGKKGDKAHKEKKYWDAAEKGKHGKKHKESHYAKKGAHKKKFHDAAKKYGKKHTHASGHKGEKFHKKKGHKKGHKVKGK